MHKIILWLILFSTFNVVNSQTDTVFTSLKGLEDGNANTQLLYSTKHSTRSIDHVSANLYVDSTIFMYNTLNVQSGKTSFIINGYENIYYPENHGQYKRIADIEFISNNPSKYIYITNSLGIDPDGRISRYDQEDVWGILGHFDDLYISREDSNHIYAVAGNWIMQSFDAGLTWDNFSIEIQRDPYIEYLTFSPFDESIMYGKNSNQLLKSLDTGKTFSPVLEINDRISEIELYFDKDETHIYALDQKNQLYPYEKAKSYFYVSSNNGDNESWELKQYYFDSKVNICLDDSISGIIFLSDGDKIYKSENYGDTFNEYMQIIHHASSLYKKPKEDIIFATVADGIIEIHHDSTIYIIKKSIKKSLELFPLSVGNKWVYNNAGYYADIDIHYVNEFYSEEIIKKKADAFNNEWYFIKKQPDGNDYWIRLDTITGYVYSKRNFSDSYEKFFIDLTSYEGNGIETSQGKIYDVIEKDTLLWDSSRNSKTFDLASVVVDNRTFAQGIGMIEAYSEFDFGQITTTLKSCIIDGEIYGDTTLVNVENELEIVPSEYSLSQNYPNPFNPTTTIKYTTPNHGGQANVASGFSLSNVQLKVYNILGQQIATLVNKKQFPGIYQTVFDASNLPSGIYYYSLSINNYISTKKMILLK